MRDALDIAERLFAAIEAGDIGVVAELYHPEVEVWHNTDGAVQDREQNLEVLRWLARNLPGVRYTEVRRRATDDGFVQQHVLVATNRAGRQVEVPACVIVRVDGERIIRLDEYLDSAHVALLTER